MAATAQAISTRAAPTRCDVSRTAATVDWFDLWVLNVRGLETWADVVYSQVHDSYRLVRVWNESGGRSVVTHIAINEIYPNPASGDNEWFELINPTGNDISLSGWHITATPLGGGNDTIRNFTASDKVEGNRTVKAWNADGPGSIPDKGQVYLYDTNWVARDWLRYLTSVGAQNPLARYRDESDNPLTDLYNTLSPTKGTKNALIPEYDSVMAPLLATVVMLAIARRARTGKARAAR
jgi:hypothetical protein